MNFISPNDFENHVLSHGDETDFEILKHYEKRLINTVKLQTLAQYLLNMYVFITNYYLHF